MNKNLETEYRNLANQEASQIDADALWNRIEAALPEKESTKEEIPNNVVAITETKKKWYKNHKLVSFAGTVAAACVLALIILSNRNSLVKNESSHHSKGNAMVEDSATAAEESASESTNEYKDVATDSEYIEDINEYESVTGTESEETDSYYEASEVSKSYTVDFVITGVQGDFFECVTTKDNELMPSGTEFFLEYNEEFVDCETELSMPLYLDESIDGKLFFIF